MNSIPRGLEDQSRWTAIENQARFLQLEMWNLRCRSPSGVVPRHPIDVLEPGVGLVLKGYEVQTVRSLDPIINARGKCSDVAGTLDHERKLVRISAHFPKCVQFFTAAHELGHVILHPHERTFHRDIPVGQIGCDRDPVEKEADWFATCFLMPAKQVRSFFQDLFACERFELKDDTAFALCTSSFDEVMKQIRSVRDLSLLLAQANLYRSQPIPPLFKIFGVSATAMAIRLEQLDLVVEPQLTWRNAS